LKEMRYLFVFSCRSISLSNVLRPVYTWRTLTGEKLNNNWTQYSRSAIFWQRNQDTGLEH